MEDIEIELIETHRALATKQVELAKREEEWDLFCEQANHEINALKDKLSALEMSIYKKVKEDSEAK